MASRRWFGYESDLGDNYAYELLETVGETPALGFGPVAADALALSLDSERPIAPRYLNLARVDVVTEETFRKKVYVGTTAALLAIAGAGSVTIDGVVWGVSSYVGERGKLIPATDTEQLDGDIDNNLAVV